MHVPRDFHEHVKVDIANFTDYCPSNADLYLGKCVTQRQKP